MHCWLNEIQITKLLRRKKKKRQNLTNNKAQLHSHHHIIQKQFYSDSSLNPAKMRITVPLLIDSNKKKEKNNDETNQSLDRTDNQDVQDIRTKNNTTSENNPSQSIESRIQTKQNKKIMRAKCQFKICQTFITNDCFLIEGDFVFYPKAFTDYEKYNCFEQFSFLNQFRPVQKITYFKEHYLDMELDSTLNHHGNIKIVKEFLSRMNNPKSYELSIYINQYELFIQQQLETVNQIYQHYDNNQKLIVEMMDSNFERSIKLAHKFISQLNQQNEMTSYFIRRVNPSNLFKKYHSMGATKSLLDLIIGPNDSDKQALKEKLLREGVPNLLDYRGYIQYILQSFSGSAKETIDLMTIDKFKVTCKIQIFSLPLSSIEIAPGCTIFDELSYTIYSPSNLKVIDIIQQQRKESQTQYNPSYQMDISDFTYEARSQHFVDKYYPETSYQLKHRRKFSKNPKKQQQKQLKSESTHYHNGQ